MKNYFLLALSLFLFTACATMEYSNEKQANDYASMQEVIDSEPASNLPLDTAVTYNFWEDNSPNVYYGDRHYRTTAKPYSIIFTESGTYEIRVKTVINLLGSMINRPAIELYSQGKDQIEIRKISQKYQDKTFLEPPCILTIFEATIAEPGKYYLIASSDLTQKKDLVINMVDERGISQMQYTCHEAPYGMYTIKIIPKK